MPGDREHLHEDTLKILCYLYRAGPAFAAKLASRLNLGLPSLKEHVRSLMKDGYIERVTGTLVDYRLDRKNRVTKHRNHTYYRLTRKGNLYMRNFQGRIEVNLRPPYTRV